jgi:membrane-bound ClpP family serine protease
MATVQKWRTAMRWKSAQLFWGLLLLGAGALMILINLDLIPQNIADLWPVPVILIGIWLIVIAVRRPRARGLTAGIVVTAIGTFWLAESFNWIGEDLFLPILLMSIGLGILIRGLFFRRSSALF